jgi:hypothetical protein
MLTRADDPKVALRWVEGWPGADHRAFFHSEEGRIDPRRLDVQPWGCDWATAGAHDIGFLPGAPDAPPN